MSYFCDVNHEFSTEADSRNLCIDGGYDICAQMYNKNMLAPLKAFIPKVCPIHFQVL